MTQDARASAARVIARVTSSGQSLPDALAVELRSLTDPGMRALAQELSYGSLRWYYRLDALLCQLLERPLKARDLDLRCLLLAGLYQLDKLALPQRVAVHETVQATGALGKRWASGLVNAVLRNFQRRSSKLEAAVAGSEQSRYAHPGWLLEMLKTDWPHARESILLANNERPPFSLRVNRLRLSRPDYLALLAGQALEAMPLAHTSHGILLQRPLPVEGLPGFSAGLVSVQDGAAQLAEPSHPLPLRVRAGRGLESHDALRLPPPSRGACAEAGDPRAGARLADLRTRGREVPLGGRPDGLGVRPARPAVGIDPSRFGADTVAVGNGWQ